MEIMQMKILVTGGSGFVGGNLARLLVSHGNEVVALVRPTSNRKALQELGVTFAEVDLHTGEGLDRAIGEVDAVIHVAGVIKANSKEDYLRGNAESTSNLCAAMARRKVPP